jgi:hypothetical protein
LKATLPSNGNTVGIMSINQGNTVGIMSSNQGNTVGIMSSNQGNTVGIMSSNQQVLFVVIGCCFYDDGCSRNYK